MGVALRFPPKVFQREDLFSQLPRLKALFSQEEVMAAYLFGSVLQGGARPGSDLDIAIQGGEGYEWARLYGRIYKGLCELLEADNIDLVILNEAPASLRAKALSEGFPLYLRGEGVTFPEMVSQSSEFCPFEGTSALTVLAEVLRGLRGEEGGDPQLLKLALMKGIRAASESAKWVIEGVCVGEYERLEQAKEALKDGLSPYRFSDWITVLLTIRKVLVHLLWKLEDPTSEIMDIPTFTNCFSQVLSYLDFALG